jgi:hypothetical protein
MSINGSGMTADEIDQWLKWTRLTSIPLKRLDQNNYPTEICSGCLINFHDRRFLLTVSHAVNLGSRDWVIELGNDEQSGAEFYRPARFCYLAGINPSVGEIENFDYSYAEVPIDLQSIFQLLTPFGAMSEKHCRHVFDSAAIAEPDRNQHYAFAGEIHPEMHASSGLVTEVAVYPGLRFIQSVGAFHQFRLPVVHPGHDFFQGCSGAPIVDTSRRLVALVSSGNLHENTVYGVPLSRYRFALDFYCNEIRPN